MESLLGVERTASGIQELVQQDRATGSRAPRGHAVELDNYSLGVVCIQTRLRTGHVQTCIRPRSVLRIDLRRPTSWQLKDIPFHRGRNVSVDNLAGGSGPCYPHLNLGPCWCREDVSGDNQPPRVHLNSAAQLSKGWGPPLPRCGAVVVEPAHRLPLPPSLSQRHG